ncbi:MAG TPA: aminotransferase class V-fold PLP-dependent enzyme [Vicinamibacterales bacterium]|nr:aminotransferase class V-fold PLP-dependent enzyme [Vicinamibacterales bacterium]
MGGRRIYLDYHATTPVDPRVLTDMLPFFTERFGNPHSRQHAWGWDADKAVGRARAQVAELIGAAANEIVFTSGASESNNLALKGAAERLRDRGRRIVTVATEHKSVLDTCRHLEQQGFEVVRMPVQPDGLLDLDTVRAALTPGTILLSVMAANNEIGTLQPLAEIAGIAHERGIVVHSDAAQAAGKIPIDVATIPVDLLSLTAHKMYGPKGAGALYIRRRNPKIQLAPQVDGGGQESGIRSGTLNVPGIVGFGRAAEICRQEMPEESVRLRGLRDALLAGLRAGIPGLHVNGTLDRRLPHNLHIGIADVDGSALLMSLGDLAVSTGSACSSGNETLSHVLQALGAVPGGAYIRFGLGRMTTADEVDAAVERLTAVVTHSRSSSPLDPSLQSPRSSPARS